MCGYERASDGEIAGGSAVEAGYPDNASHHLTANDYSRNQTWPEPMGAGDAQARRPFPQRVHIQPGHWKLDVSRGLSAIWEAGPLRVHRRCRFERGIRRPRQLQGRIQPPGQIADRKLDVPAPDRGRACMSSADGRSELWPPFSRVRRLRLRWRRMPRTRSTAGPLRPNLSRNPVLASLERMRLLKNPDSAC